jgi:hypothetical protein
MAETAVRPAGVPLSTDLRDPEAFPYFLWDDPIPVREIHRRLRTSTRTEQVRLLAKILREARDTEVWEFTTPGEVAGLWPELSPHLGRRRAFWDFLLSTWKQQGRIDSDPPR